MIFLILVLKTFARVKSLDGGGENFTTSTAG